MTHMLLFVEKDLKPTIIYDAKAQRKIVFLMNKEKEN